uniref:Replication-associated protein G2P n=1 Tax=Dulem virus 62 TaxID=3145773 RepID=A0AAU8B113_9VIRU
MLDTLEIHIPIQAEFIYSIGEKLFSVIGEVAHYGLTGYGQIIYDVDLNSLVPTGIQKHAYESLPSSHGGMAFKFFSHNVANTLPYVALKASAKFLEGHNIFGSESVQKLACEMLATLKKHYPIFYTFLDIDNARISRLDATYSARLADESLVSKTLDFLRNISSGQRKKDTDRRDFYNTVYWGGRTSRHGNAVAYGKHNDVIEHYKDMVKKAKDGCKKTSEYLETIFYDELLDYSKGLLRFESRSKARLLERLGIPTNLWSFIRYQKKNPDVLKTLWNYWFKPIFEAMKGEVMHLNDDEKVKALCYEKLWTITKKGKKSYTKAKNAYNFYMRLKQSGFEAVKADYNRRAFEIALKSLVDLGLPKALLQNIEKSKDTEVPVFKLITIDFSKQSPNPDYDLSRDDGEYPSYYQFDKYINGSPPTPPPLRFVA